MSKIVKVWDGTDPGNTPGRVFTASIPQETIIPDGKELSFLKFGMKGAVSSAAVVIEDFASLLSEYTLRVGSETRVLLDGQDMVAVMSAFYGELPTIGENTDATGNDFIGGLKLPLYAAVDQAKPITHAATRTAVTNIATETLACSAYFDMGETGRKPMHMVKIPFTTAAAAGYDTPGFRLAPVGTLKKLIIRQPNGFADGNIDVSVQRLRILVNGQMHSQFNLLADFTPVAEIDHVTPSPMGDLLRPYGILDFGNSGIDCKGQEVTIQLDVQDVSDAVDIIPLIELA